MNTQIREILSRQIAPVFKMISNTIIVCKKEQWESTEIKQQSGNIYIMLYIGQMYGSETGT
jgi:hypothetical protein